MKYLGIDYGKKKVGLAISEGLSASPFQVIESSGLADAVSRIEKIIHQHQIDRVVIGLAESGESRSMTEKFIALLKKMIDVIVVEETLSSYYADEQMRMLGVAKSKRGRNDAVAATYILEQYLDSLK